MDKITREYVLALMTNDWAEYGARIQAFAPSEKASFLERQGYKRLADLLAHIAAWWKVGLDSIQRYKTDPLARQLEIDVDTFNARAVQAANSLSDEQELQLFERTRLKFVELLLRLTEADFKDERILTQIKWEVVNHLEEHKLSG